MDFALEIEIFLEEKNSFLSFCVGRLPNLAADGHCMIFLLLAR
jgi:hypothetical protein